ncbi:MAG: ATP-binding protein [Wujia sp.]
MNNYRKYTIAIIIIELLVILGCNVALQRAQGSEADRSCFVEIKRAADELKSGTTLDDIDLGKYKSILKISEFKPGQVCNNDYRVEEINGVLYRFEYKQEDNSRWILALNIVLGIFFVLTLFVFVFIGRKVIKPFHSMNYLVEELAKGNLSTPVKAEKSKFFGKFLWGVDMLREKLEQDKIREMELVKDRKTLILSLSHDIKTPLSAIDLYTKALSQNLYDSEEDRLKAVKGIENNTEEIKKYVNEISKASREEFLSLSVNNREYYLGEAIHMITRYYREKMLNNHTAFDVQEVRDCLINGDPDRTVEVLQNIIENALKYGDGKEISISFDEEEDCKLINVSNTGCSLSEDELNHIFDSFYRGSNTDNISGSGLGLYICKKILHKMDGEVFAKISGDIFCVTVVLRKV